MNEGSALAEALAAAGQDIEQRKLCGQLVFFDQYERHDCLCAIINHAAQGRQLSKRQRLSLSRFVESQLPGSPRRAA